MKIKVLIMGMLLIGASAIWGQEKLQQMDLTGCIDYALKNNIQIKKSKVTLETSEITSKQAKAQRLPDLNGQASGNLVNRPLLTNGGDENSFSGNYSLNSSMTLYNGGRISKNIKQQELTVEANKYVVLEAEKSIEMTILQLYLRILYSSEKVSIDKATLDVSLYQVERAKSLRAAGSISEADLAKLEAQYATDKYQLVTSENGLKSSQLELKQLLELNVTDEMTLMIPNLDSLNVLKPLPELPLVYDKSLASMPQVKGSKINSDIAVLDTKIYKADYLPRVNLNASVGTNHSSVSSYSYNDQLHNNYSNGVGVSVSVPIFNNRSTKSNVQRAKLREITAQLNMQETEKALLKEVELAYQDAVSAQSQYVAASEKVKALQTSYDLITQQFNLGMKNTLDLLTEKNNLLSAQQSLLQSKYLSIMNAQLLNLYQDYPLEIK